MISAGEVGAVFTVKDDASAVLQRLADEFNKLQEVIDRIKASIESIGGMDSGLGKLQEQLKATGTAGADASQIITDAFGKVDGAVDTAIGRVNALKDSFAQAAEAARAINVTPGMGGGRMGGGGGRAASSAEEGEYPHLNVQPHRLGHGFSLSGLAPAWLEAPIAGLIYGETEDQKVRDSIAKSVIAAKVPEDQQDEAQASLYARIKKSARDYHFSPEETAKAYMKPEFQMAGLSFDQRSALEDALMPYAAGEARMKHTSLDDAMSAFVGSAHMFQVYDPEQIKHMASGLQMASLFSPASLPQFERAASYPSVLHTELGMDANTIWLQTAAMQAAGIRNTKSGTWLKNFWQNIMPSVGDSKSEIAHNEALQQLGLNDEHNQRTWGSKLTADGKIDYNAAMFEIAKTMSEHTADMAVENKVDAFHHAFGEQGKGFAALMDSQPFVEQLIKVAALRDKYESTEKGGLISDITKLSPLEQLRAKGTDLQTSLMDASHTLTPDATKALGDLATAASQAAGAIHTAFGWMQSAADMANKTQDIAKQGHDFMAKTLGLKPDVPLDLTTRPPYDPLSSVHAGSIHDTPTPSGVALSGGANNAKLAAAASIPVSISSPVTAPLTGTATVNVTVNNAGLLAEVKQVVQAEIKGAFSGLMGMFKSGSGNSSAGFDGRSAPSTPDGSIMHGAH